MSYKNAAWRKKMTVTLDYGNMMTENLGTLQGLRESDLNDLKPALEKADRTLRLARTGGKLPFFDLPYQKDTVKAIQSVVKAAKGKFDNVVVCGIGGSALGNLCLHSALNHPRHNELDKKARKGWPKVYVPDNVDPDFIKSMLDVLDLKKTLVNVITKSGSTAETMGTFMLFYDKLVKAVGKKKVAKHLIITTDREKGALREIANELGVVTFEVPDGVGGRFSVLTPVGMISAALSGINIEELLAGAEEMDKRRLKARGDLTKDPAMLLGSLLYLADKKQRKPIHVMMPYSNRLYLLADWFRQLWAESLGKDRTKSGRAVRVGPTPVKALGATDQHSQCQLYMEGPFDKVIIFLRVAAFGNKLTIPKVFKNKSGLTYLGGKDFGQLLNAEQTGTQLALTENNRSNMTLNVPEINAFTLGQMIYLLEVATAYAGELYDINAYDQPGVEAAKIATYALMGKKGFEAKRKEIQTKLKKPSRYTV